MGVKSLLTSHDLFGHEVNLHFKNNLVPKITVCQKIVRYNLHSSERLRLIRSRSGKVSS